MTTVKMLGIGAGEETMVLDRSEIEKILNAVDDYEVFRIAYSARVRGYKSGECRLDLRTGKLTAGSYSVGKSDQAVDDVNICLMRIDQNEDFDGLIDEDNDPYNINDMLPDGQVSAKRQDIAAQLDAWYEQVEFA